MWYMPMHIAACELGGSLYCFSLYETICLFIKQACLIAIVSKLGWGDDSILWLSFVQQKDKLSSYFLSKYVSM
jgi:hypothetical protein